MLTLEHLARGDNLRAVPVDRWPVARAALTFVRGLEHQFPTYEQYVEALWRDRQARIAESRNRG